MIKNRILLVSNYKEIFLYWNFWFSTTTFLM